MKTASIEKAITGHTSSIMSYPVMDYILKKGHMSRSDIIAIYLFVNYIASREQLLKVCCYKKDQSSNLYISLKRMEEKKLIEKIIVDDESNSVTLYFLSRKGISNSKNLFCENFIDAVNDDNKLKELFHFAKKDEDVSPAECCEYMAEQYSKFNFNKKQFSHFIGERELPLAFLSNTGYSSPYLYSASHEVVYDIFGEPVSVYDRLYKGLLFHKGEVRTDTAISFYVGKGEKDSINFYVEHDTGSQKASILKDKVEQYMEYVFEPLLRKNPAFLPFLIFSISDKVNEKEISSAATSLEFKTRERYLARGISLAASVYLGLHDDMYGVSLYELRDFISSISLSQKDRVDFLPFIDACIASVGGDKNAIDIVDKLYEASKQVDDDKEHLYRQRYENYYKNRRDLLYGSIDSIPGIKELFLSGVSVCTVSNRKSVAVRTFLPECCSMSAIISRAFSTAALPVSVKSLRAISRFSLLEGGEIVLRNIYVLSDGRTIAVENIGDDYGAYCRIRYLLETNMAPCEILCTFSNLDSGRIKHLFQSFSKQDCLSHFHIATYVVREEEVVKERGRSYSYDNVFIPGVIKAALFMEQV